MATVEIKGVSKWCGKQTILHDIHLSIERGEFVAVVGPSGSGKSTLLRLVAGLEEVSEGSILINGQCVNKTQPSERNMAMVFQNYALYPHMTAYANMAYGLKRRKLSKEAVKERITEVSRMLQIEDYLQRKPASLSGGQKQRVAMGRAIVRSPAVFLFDEPLSSLDAKLRTEMRHEIRKLHDQLKSTCLYVTHDQTEAMTLADRVVILNKGTIEQIDTPQHLYQNPATSFVASFIGHYPINFLPATLNVKENKITTSIGMELPMPVFEKERLHEDIMIGIRPEHISVKPIFKPGCFLARIDLVDDLGADKLVQLTSEEGDSQFLMRVFGELPCKKDAIVVEMGLKHASIFCSHTGERIGRWHEQ